MQMRRVAAIQLAVAAGVILALAGSTSATQAARSGSPPCSQATQPAWIDYGDKWVPFRRLFFQPGLTVALAHDAPAADARRGGAQLAFWDMSLRRAVGTPAKPADPRTIPAATARVLEDAVRVTGCSTPVIGLNELFEAQRPAPWRPRTARYRANVLVARAGPGRARCPAAALHLSSRRHGRRRGELVARGRAGRNDRSRAVPAGSVAARVRPRTSKRVHALRATARRPQPDDDRRSEQPGRHRSRLPDRPRRPDGPRSGAVVRGRQARDAGNAAGRGRVGPGLRVVVGLGHVSGQPHRPGLEARGLRLSLDAGGQSLRRARGGRLSLRPLPLPAGRGQPAARDAQAPERAPPSVVPSGHLGQAGGSHRSAPGTARSCSGTPCSGCSSARCTRGRCACRSRTGATSSGCTSRPRTRRTEKRSRPHPASYASAEADRPG